MAPYQQGRLDGLCGVYSIINASREPLKIQESTDLRSKTPSKIDFPEPFPFIQGFISRAWRHQDAATLCRVQNRRML
jgi:hypothetical protein